MKVTLFMASSTNGIIARSNGEEDFLSDKNWETFKGLAEKYGCFTVGRKTYQAVSKWKDYNFDNIKAQKIIVSSKNTNFPDGYLSAKSPKEAIKKASNKGYKKLLLTGGGALNTSFIKENLIDEIIVNIEPFILGKGIKLFKEENFEKKLKLISTKKLPGDIIQIKYKVK